MRRRAYAEVYRASGHESQELAGAPCRRAQTPLGDDARATTPLGILCPGRASSHGRRTLVAQHRAAGSVAQATTRASAWRHRDTRGRRWSARLPHAPGLVSMATPLHPPSPGVGHSHSERGARVPGARP